MQSKKTCIRIGRIQVTEAINSNAYFVSKIRFLEQGVDAKKIGMATVLVLRTRIEIGKVQAS